MEIVKDSRAEFKKDSSGQFDLESVFIIQVINHKGDVGYTGQQDGKHITVGKICHLVTKFADYKSAKTFANSIRGAQTNILGKNRIEKILLEQESDQDANTIPLDQVEGDMYRVVVKNKLDGELVGYISWKPDTDEYSVINGTEKAAFWQDVKKADSFIDVASKQFFVNMPDLVLEKVKFK